MERTCTSQDQDAKLHIPRCAQQAVAHKHFIYIFGGYCKRYLDTIEKYNLLTGKIELLDVKLRVARSDFSVVKINSDVYILIGCTWCRENGGDDPSLCEIFNLETEEMREGETFPFENWGYTACVV